MISFMIASSAQISCALAFAKHGTGDTGNANFPFDMADHFNDTDGDERLDR